MQTASSSPHLLHAWTCCIKSRIKVKNQRKTPGPTKEHAIRARCQPHWCMTPARAPFARAASRAACPAPALPGVVPTCAQVRHRKRQRGGMRALLHTHMHMHTCAPALSRVLGAPDPGISNPLSHASLVQPRGDGGQEGGGRDMKGGLYKERCGRATQLQGLELGMGGW